jgi:hypothetical protein
LKRFVIPVAKRSLIAKYAAAAALAAVLLALSTLALAQAPVSAQCGEYVEVYKSGPSGPGGGGCGQVAGRAGRSRHLLEGSGRIGALRQCALAEQLVR